MKTKLQKVSEMFYDASAKASKMSRMSIDMRRKRDSREIYKIKRRAYNSVALIALTEYIAQLHDA